MNEASDNIKQGNNISNTTSTTATTSSSIQETRGLPGEVITPEDACLLELRPLRNYCIDEIVAVEVPATTPVPAGLISGIPISGIKATPTDEVDTKHMNIDTPTMEMDTKEMNIDTATIKVYGKVLNIGTPSDEGLRRITIKVNNHQIITLLSTHVFSFKSAREINTIKPTSTVLKASFNPISNKTQQINIESIIKHSVEDRENKEISQNELIEAVNSILNRAGVPMQKDQQVSISNYGFKPLLSISNFGFNCIMYMYIYFLYIYYT